MESLRFIATALSLALAGGLAAQQATDTAPKSQAPSTAAASKSDTAPKADMAPKADTGAKSSPALMAPPVGIAPLGITITEEAIVATGWRASKLMHATVYNEQNQKIGKIDDFIVSPDGTMSAAIVDVGGFLGLGAHKVAIPTKQLGGVAPKIVLKGATKEALKALPEFKYLA